MQRFGNKKALIVHVGQNGYHVPDTSKAGNDNRFVQHFLMNSRQNVFNKKKKKLISYVSLPNHILEVCITHQSSSFCSRSKMKTRTKLPFLVFRMPLFCSIIATNKTKFFVNKFKNKSKKLFKKLNQKLQVKALVLTILGCEYKFIKCI